MYATRNIYIILILNIFCVSALAEPKVCPYPEPECECDVYVDVFQHTSSTCVVCTDLQRIPPLRNNSLRVTDAHFYGGNFSVADNSLPADLISLEFDRIPLTSISDNAFQTSVKTLNSLSITNAKFKRLPDALLKLTNLTSLTIKGTLIEVWNNATLQHLAKTVNTLILMDVGLIGWPSWFSFFHTLTEFDFTQNSIQFVPEDAFISTNNTLTQVTLGGCNLTQVPKALSNLRNLIFLDLSNNSIADVDGRPGIEQLILFPFASTLQTLTIISIGLTKFPLLPNMTKLHTIQLSNNQISDPTTDSYPPGVTVIFLDGNKLTSVPAAFTNLSSLSYLSLANNQITDFSFHQLPLNLTKLNLKYNKITQVTDTASTNTSLTLQSLSLASNPIKTISIFAFRNLGSLQTLQLEDTNLTGIPLALTSLTSLKSLSLPSLPCPYPPPKDLVDWYKSRQGLIIYGTCSSIGRDIEDYLSNGCEPEPTIPCQASTMFSVWCLLGYLLLLLTTNSCL